MQMQTQARARRSAGEILKTWRKHRGLSQLQLAGRAEVSQKHLSFLESGRAVPSREMVLRLTRVLSVPQRERNEVLLAAGLAPVFRERPITDPELGPIRAAVERVLRAYEPFPALAIDRRWNMVLSNAAVAPLLAGVDPTLLSPPVNVLRLSLHPRGLAPHIVNLGQWREHLFARLASQVDATGDAELRALADELRGYRAPCSHDSGSELGDIAVPLELRVGEHTLRFVSMTTVFGTPLDVTLSELAIESFLPADEATSRLLLETSRNT